MLIKCYFCVAFVLLLCYFWFYLCLGVWGLFGVFFFGGFLGLVVGFLDSIVGFWLVVGFLDLIGCFG